MRVVSAIVTAACLSSGALIACGGPAAPSAPKTLTAKEIVERYKPAIVRVERELGGQHGVGTGFFVSEEGRIATNLHVIAGGGKIQVKLSDGRVVPVERIVAVDQQRDLAILEVDLPQKAPVIPLGDSDKVAAGDAVIAIGNPLRLDFTVSDGLISSVRTIEKDTFLQISAPISQGSSGGPLFNSFGEAIGVATLVSSSGQNLNFGVPVNYLRPLLAHQGHETVSEFSKRFKKKEQPTTIKTSHGVIKRKIPTHKTSILSECQREHVVKVFSGINRAIELGAPLYNDGDHEACFGIYQQTATHFEKDANICKGLRDAFGDGLLRASTMEDFTRKAWAMRDTFDGLLDVIVRRAREIEGQP